MGNGRWTRGLCALGLSLMATTGCQQAAPARGFVLRYEDPAPADRADARFLEDRRVAEPVLAALNAYVALPHRVTVSARSCAGEGTGYDPAARRIELCYDDLPEEREPFLRAGEAPADEQLTAVVRETLHHEAGHALLDALGATPDSARAEEDAADDFARLMLLREGPPGEDTLLTAARAYDLAPPAPDPDDEHAPPPARAEAHRCAVHTTSPHRIPTPPSCPTPWPHAQSTWTKALTPLLR
ncbi:DUF4344 domain-containing metallopeptidase [Streptomyces sp. RerS4]|uniref:DUF4344 domain-containing metallopeptidase n=1 Tax=Streptomyces sp. RerS4 TaxID=2942449 RepID=UPI00201BABE5|nr:DUF4344 domain-containing metallopeptidase [Streptomyces sp. RerS4]UQX02708.1 DUF4344 domain-containing metallopeptidase [Streptomyces sp. RerS4]